MEKKEIENDNHIIPKDDNLAEFAMSATELADTYTSDQLESAYEALRKRYRGSLTYADPVIVTLVGKACLIHEVRAAMAEKKEEPAA